MDFHRKLAGVLKHTYFFYLIYFYGVSLFLRMIGFLASPQKVILFNSFGGKKFDDSPRALFESIKRDPFFKGWRLVWAFHKPEKFHVDGGEKIKTDTIEYFLTALRARIWITNSSIERGLDFKPKHTFYVNTWHGSTIKKMGKDIPNQSDSFKSKGTMRVDLMTAQNEEQATIFSRVFDIPREKFLVCGLPRNDILCHVTEKMKLEARKKLSLPMGKKVILYAPTFREYDRDAFGCVMKPPIHAERWKETLGDRYVLLFRAHYEVAKVMGIQSDEFLYDETAYPDLNDLMIASDMLITDYSSIAFDYSLLQKPIVLYCYDFDKYQKLRGLYFDFREYLDCCESEEELLSLLTHWNQDKEKNKLQTFSERFLCKDGNAVKTV